MGRGIQDHPEIYRRQTHGDSEHGTGNCKVSKRAGLKNKTGEQASRLTSLKD